MVMQQIVVLDSHFRIFYSALMYFLWLLAASVSISHHLFKNIGSGFPLYYSALQIIYLEK